MDKLISIDTNVIVRFLTEDDQQQFEKAKDLIKKNSIFVPTTVILETDWVLRFAYKFKNEDISKAFSRFFGLPNVIAENAKVLENAIAWSQAGLEFADALHLGSWQLLNYRLCYLQCLTMEVATMKTSTVEQNGLTSDSIDLIKRLTAMIPWPARRKAKADVVDTLLEGKTRVAEDVFGWGRAAIVVGRQERDSGERHADNIASRRKPTTEERFPGIERDIHLLFDSKSQADARLGTTLRYLNASASNVRKALVGKGYPDEYLPSERTINSLLNRMGFRLRTVQKAKPQKKRRKPT